MGRCDRLGGAEALGLEGKMENGFGMNYWYHNYLSQPQPQIVTGRIYDESLFLGVIPLSHWTARLE